MKTINMILLGLLALNLIALSIAVDKKYMRIFSSFTAGIFVHEIFINLLK